MITQSFRSRHNLTQAQLAALLRVSWRTVQKWELGYRRPPWYLGLALRWLEVRIVNKKK